MLDQIMTNNYIQIVDNALKSAEQNLSHINTLVLKIPGMSSRKVRHFLNNVCNFQGCRYLEVGSHRGSTFCSAISNNEIYAVAIDNFSGCQNMLGSNPVKEIKDNIDKFKTKSTVFFENSDCWSINILKHGKFNVYFYDANHEEKYQYKAFTYFNNVFEDQFIAIVDDYRNDFVQKGTKNVFNDLKYKIIGEWERKVVVFNDDAGWWNGIYVAVIQK